MVQQNGHTRHPGRMARPCGTVSIVTACKVYSCHGRISESVRRKPIRRYGSAGAVPIRGNHVIRMGQGDRARVVVDGIHQNNPVLIAALKDFPVRIPVLRDVVVAGRGSVGGPGLIS